ncbi:MULTISPECIES: MarC family protein [Fusobacterium]|jgi:multiple antibiotic resistance protein|uniref:UPF0056 membrane protein n=1 Tax=Fusobacterium hominis TaxID=2764326 RepID=A0A7G9GUD5_9FUSO|nr:MULTISPECIES: MarC family protein [Fusobacterium]QNM14417.1 MarC family protein [Fusobacterium hominis]
MNFMVILTSTLTLIAVLNPFGNVPLFIGMTEGMDKKTRSKILNIVVLTAFLITLLFSLIGNFLMTKFYQIDMEELKMAGGLILIVIATKNIISPEPKAEDNSCGSLQDELKKAIIPMAFPMLVGPGVLTTTLITRAKYGVLINIEAIIASFLIIYVVFWVGNYIERILGKLVLYILSRVMQIFILAIGFRIFFTGLADALRTYHIIG